MSILIMNRYFAYKLVYFEIKTESSRLNTSRNSLWKLCSQLLNLYF